MAAETGKEPDPEYATRRGELALLLNSLGNLYPLFLVKLSVDWSSATVATVAGIVLPSLASRNRHLLAHDEDVDEDAELSRLRETVKQWRIEAAHNGKPLRLPYMPFLLRNIWSFSLLLFSLLTWSTFFIRDTAGVRVFPHFPYIC